MEADKTEGRTERERRRVVDERMTSIETQIEAMTQAMAENTKLTKDIQSLLLSFKVMAHIGKWVTVIALMISAVIAAIHSLRGA